MLVSSNSRLEHCTGTVGLIGPTITETIVNCIKQW